MLTLILRETLTKLLANNIERRDRMNKVITAVMGLGMLYAQAVSANEMVRYEHGLFVADASSAQSAKSAKPAKASKAAKSAKAAPSSEADDQAAHVSKSTKHHGKKHHKHHAKKHHGHKHHNKHHANKHHHKHHHHHRHHNTGCPHPEGCMESGMYAPRNASMAYGQPSLEQVEPNMDVLNRERAARSGRSR